MEHVENVAVDTYVICVILDVKVSSKEYRKMIEFFEQLAELLKSALAELELDEGCDPEYVSNVEVEIYGKGNCIVFFPDSRVRYFATNWDITSKQANWLLSRQ